MSLQVTYMDVPKGVQKTLAATADTGQPFSNAGQLVEGAKDISWATLEPNGWVLDGSGKLLTDTPEQMGWWSREPSNAQKRFLNPPVITVTLPEPCTATGLTFRFSPSTNQWCSHIQVTWYRGEALLDRTEANPTAADWTLYHPVENFDRVEITLLETNRPYHFAKLQQLQIGQVMVFMGDELVKVRLLNEADPSMRSLPVDTMTVEFRDKKSRVIRPQKDSMVRLYRDNVLLATHYVTEVQRESGQHYLFRCQSGIGQLEGTFWGGMYVEYPLETLLQEVLGDRSFAVDDAFANVTVTGYLPMCTRQQALQQIAFTVGALVTTREDGCILLQMLPEKTSGYFSDERIFAGTKAKQIMPAAAVELVAHSYTPEEERKVLLNETDVFGEDVLFVFSEPYYDYQLAGGTLTGSGINWVRITADCPVFLTAKKYYHSKTVYRKENSIAPAGNVVTVEKATLINDQNAEAALQRIYNYYTMQDLLTQDVTVNGEKVGQKVESITPWESPVVGHIVAMESEFTNTGHRANVLILGEEVQLL